MKEKIICLLDADKSITEDGVMMISEMYSEYKHPHILTGYEYLDKRKLLSNMDDCIGIVFTDHLENGKLMVYSVSHPDDIADFKKELSDVRNINKSSLEVARELV